MTAVPGLLAVEPHPDDETVGVGGVLARCSAEGRRSAVVTCTGGEAGLVFGDVDLAGTTLAEVRADEIAASLVALGVADHTLLGYRDSGMVGWATNREPGAFTSADPDEVAQRLASIVRAFRPDVVVGDDVRGTYGHPDHVQAHAVTTAALRLAAEAAFEDGHPPWLVRKRYVHVITHRHVRTLHARLLAQGRSSPFGPDPLGPDDLPPLGVPEEAVTATVDVSPWREVKRRAIHAHASQYGPGGLLYEWVAADEDDVLSTERFVRLDPPPDGTHEDDLFTGL